MQKQRVSSSRRIVEMRSGLPRWRSSMRRCVRAALLHPPPLPRRVLPHVHPFRLGLSLLLSSAPPFFPSLYFSISRLPRCSSPTTFLIGKAIEFAIKKSFYDHIVYASTFGSPSPQMPSTPIRLLNRNGQRRRRNRSRSIKWTLQKARRKVSLLTHSFYDRH